MLQFGLLRFDLNWLECLSDNYELLRQISQQKWKRAPSAPCPRLRPLRCSREQLMSRTHGSSSLRARLSSLLGLQWAMGRLGRLLPKFPIFFVTSAECERLVVVLLARNVWCDCLSSTYFCLSFISTCLNHLPGGSGSCEYHYELPSEARPESLFFIIPWHVKASDAQFYGIGMSDFQALVRVRKKAYIHLHGGKFLSPPGGCCCCCLHRRNACSSCRHELRLGLVVIGFRLATFWAEAYNWMKEASNKVTCLIFKYWNCFWGQV